jgi:hypothetical protein
MPPPYANQAAALADYQANVNYEYAKSVSMAQAFVTAGMCLLALRPDGAANRGTQLTINNRTIQSEIDRARIYINRVRRIGSVKTLGVDSSFRGQAVSLSNDPLEVPT